VIADPEEDLLAALGRLITKMQRAISVKHLEEGELDLQFTEAGVVRGLIDWDAEGNANTRLLVIDGQKITWEEFDRCLMPFEGFQFKLEVCDKSEEI
jgi:hypothetical protein